MSFRCPACRKPAMVTRRSVQGAASVRSTALSPAVGSSTAPKVAQADSLAYVYRRRECVLCKRSIGTYEIPASDLASVSAGKPSPTASRVLTLARAWKSHQAAHAYLREKNAKR